MIKTNILLMAVWLFVSHAFAQKGDLKFNKVRIVNSTAVEYIKSSEHKVVVNGNAKYPDNKYFELKGDNWLVIDGIETSKITIHGPDLKYVDIPGNGKFYSKDVVVSKELTIDVSGIGRVELEMKVEELEVGISGSGKMILKGEAETMEAEISGAAKLIAGELVVQEADIEISGAGKATVDVKKELNAEISGAGSVNYISKPEIVNKEISGVGIVGEGNIDVPDTTRISLWDKKIIIIDDGEIEIIRKDRKVKAHWAGFELALNSLVTKDFKTDPVEGYEFLELNRNKSVAVNLNIFDHEVDLHGKHIMFNTGLGLSWNNYFFKSNEYIDPESSEVRPINDSVAYAKNKLVVSYLTIPVLFEFNTSEYKKQTIHFTTGVITGIRLGSHYKMTRGSGGQRIKKKVYNSFNLSPFKFDATVRFGFRNFTIFGTYSLNNFFKDNKEPELHPVTVGIRLIGW